MAALNLGGWAEEVEVLADGTFLVGGSFNGPVFVAKVQPDGVGRITSFGTNGVTALNFGRDGSAIAGMKVDAQGRIVVGADVFNFVNGNSTPGDFAAGRLLPNGALDTSFAGDGTAVVDAGGSELANGLVVQQDGKVIIGGLLRFLTANITDSAMVRFTEAGALDPTFDGDGIFRQSIVTTYTPDAITDLVLQDDGKLLALTGWGDDFRIARFHLGAQTFPLSSADTLDVLDDDAANQPPTAQNQSIATAEDTPKTGTVVATDPDSAALTYSVVAQPANGTLAFNPATGAFTYTPNANYFGSDSFTFKANDGAADSNVATVSVTVTAVNDAPVAQDRSFEFPEDPLPPGFAGTLVATDVDSAALTYSVVAQPANGTVTITNAATGAFTYRPRFNFTGTDTFTFKANDGSADSNTATVTITVTPVNDAPFPSPPLRELTTPEDMPVSGQLTATDPEGDPVTFTLEAGPTNGTLSLAPSGAFTFTPAANFSGIAEFAYRAADPSGAFNFGGVKITVTPVNDAPVGVADAYTVAEDGVLTISAAPVTRLRMVSEPGDFVGAGLTYDFVPATATFSAATNFDNGVRVRVVPPTFGGDWTLEFAAPNEVLLTPGMYLDAQRFPFQAAGHPGLDVSGNGRGSNTLTGRFTVYDVVRDASGVVSFAAAFEQHNAGNPPALLGWVIFNSTFGAGGGVLANDTDVEGDLLLGATLVSGPSNGTLAFKGDGTFSYTPNPNFHGTDTFTYRANDGRADSAVTTVTITVTPVNDPPAAAGFQFGTNEDTPLNETLRASDVDGDALTYSVVAQPAQGTVQVTNAATGAFTYTPPPDFTGTVSFTFKVNDGTADSNVATVFVTVRPVNDAPVAAGQSLTTAEDSAVSGTGAATDVDSPTLTFAVVASPAHGSLAFNPTTGAFTYTPNANFNGSDSFTFKANDGLADSNVATVSITVTAVNDAPVAQGQAVSTDEDAAVGGQLTATDIDSPTLTFAAVANPAHGTLTVNPNGTFTYTPSANFNGTDSFTFKASDGSADSNVATVSITVRPVNDTAVAASQSVSTNEDTPVGGAVTATDIDSPVLTFAVVAQPANGTLTLNPATGAFTYTPRTNFNGTDSFTFRANDGAANSNVATVTVTGRPVNDAPTATPAALTVEADSPLGGVLAGIDVDGDALTFAVVAPPAHGTVTVNPNGSFTYTPAAGYTGPDSFTFKANDGTADSPAATVAVTVVASGNAAPVAKNKSVTTKEDRSVTSEVRATDADGDDLTFAVVTGPAHGTVTLNPATGRFTYTPAADYFGPDSFTFRASDGTATSNVATVSITVTPVDDDPVLPPATFTVPENSPAGTVVGTVAGTDPDGDALRYSIVGGNTDDAFTIHPTTGRITVADPGALDYEETRAFTLTVKVKDPDGNSDTATITIRLTDMAEALRVRIDIKPDDRRNEINPRSRGKIEVAILSAAGFDARQVDVDSLRFGRTGAEDSLSTDPRGRPRYHYEDVNCDGRLDLVVEFETELTGLRSGDTKGVLTGRLKTGQSFTAEDRVSTETGWGWGGGC